MGLNVHNFENMQNTLKTFDSINYFVNISAMKACIDIKKLDRKYVGALNIRNHLKYPSYQNHCYPVNYKSCVPLKGRTVVCLRATIH